MLTPHCSAASGMVVPPSIAPTTRLRRSSEYGFAIHAGLLPAGSLNHIRAAMGIPDSAFPGNALKAVASSYGLKPDRSAVRRTHVTLKLSSGSGGFWFFMYSTHTSSVTFPLLATQ